MPLVVFLVLAALGPNGVSWTLALLAMTHGSHQLTVGSPHGDVDLVLHHHHDAVEVEHDALGAEGHSHDDHVIRAAGTGWAVAANGAAQVHPLSQLCTLGNVGSLRRAGARSVPHGAAPYLIGPAPPVRTVVLRI